MQWPRGGCVEGLLLRLPETTMAGRASPSISAHTQDQVLPLVDRKSHGHDVISFWPTRETRYSLPCERAGSDTLCVLSAVHAIHCQTSRGGFVLEDLIRFVMLYLDPIGPLV